MWIFLYWRQSQTLRLNFKLLRLSKYHTDVRNNSSFSVDILRKLESQLPILTRARCSYTFNSENTYSSKTYNVPNSSLGYKIYNKAIRIIFNIFSPHLIISSVMHDDSGSPQRPYFLLYVTRVCLAIPLCYFHDLGATPATPFAGAIVFVTIYTKARSHIFFIFSSTGNPTTCLLSWNNGYTRVSRDFKTRLLSVNVFLLLQLKVVFTKS